MRLNNVKQVSRIIYFRKSQQQFIIFGFMNYVIFISNMLKKIYMPKNQTQNDKKQLNQSYTLV
jgi:hypothetical protein